MSVKRGEVSSALASRSSAQPTVDLVLVVTENDGGRCSLLQALEKINHLGLLFDVFNLLNDVHASSSSSTDVDNDGLHQRLLSKVLDTLGHSGREEKSLALMLYGRESAHARKDRERAATNLEEAHNVPHILLEPHVNHAIGFVEAEVLAASKAELALLEHVLQTSGGGDDHVETARHDLALLGHVDTTDTQEGANAARGELIS